MKKLDKLKSKEMLKTIGEIMAKANEEENCICNIFNDEEYANLCADLALACWTDGRPDLTMHVIIYAFLAGKEVAEKEILENMTKEPIQ